MMKWSIGIGTTNVCNMKCLHCYSRSSKYYYITVEEIAKLVESIQVNSINFGTGENGLNPHFTGILKYLNKRNIKMSLTSNGYTIQKLLKDELACFNDIDVSIDFPTKEKNDRFRGEGAFDMAIGAIKKCKDIGIETSIACCMTNRNYRRIGTMVKLARELGISNLRVNIYKPVHTNEFTTDYEEFWTGIALLLENSEIISCSEPIVNTVIGINKISSRGSPCGKNSFRVKPNREIVPCVYWKKGDIRIADLNQQGELAILKSKEFQKMNIVPNKCKGCEFEDICRGGCTARRYYRDLNSPDRYCYIINQRPTPELTYHFAADTNRKNFVHSGYLCTIIVESL